MDDKKLEQFKSDLEYAIKGGGQLNDGSMNPNVFNALLKQVDNMKLSAAKEGERHGRMNEHHVISGILRNSELTQLSIETVASLKARFAVLKNGDI